MAVWSLQPLTRLRPTEEQKRAAAHQSTGAQTPGIKTEYKTHLRCRHSWTYFRLFLGCLFALSLLYCNWFRKSTIFGSICLWRSPRRFLYGLPAANRGGKRGCQPPANQSANTANTSSIKKEYKKALEHFSYTYDSTNTLFLPLCRMSHAYGSKKSTASGQTAATQGGQKRGAAHQSTGAQPPANHSANTADTSSMKRVYKKAPEHFSYDSTKTYGQNVSEMWRKREAQKSQNQHRFKWVFCIVYWAHLCLCTMGSYTSLSVCPSVRPWLDQNSDWTICH